VRHGETTALSPEVNVDLRLTRPPHGGSWLWVNSEGPHGASPHANTGSDELLVYELIARCVCVGGGVPPSSSVELSCVVMGLVIICAKEKREKTLK